MTWHRLSSPIKSKLAIFVIPFRTSSFHVKLTMSKPESKTRGDEVMMLAELADKYLARARGNPRENWADLLKVLFQSVSTKFEGLLVLLTWAPMCRIVRVMFHVLIGAADILGGAKKIVPLIISHKFFQGCVAIWIFTPVKLSISFMWSHAYQNHWISKNCRVWNEQVVCFILPWDVYAQKISWS